MIFLVILFVPYELHAQPGDAFPQDPEEFFRPIGYQVKLGFCVDTRT